ncbi:ISAs1 family transposase [Streptomyces sp. NBC_01142]|uniref:ISAs1 family transposase n=1 Tax=Streptomyces sp. NBC_01142 TaxID=2975865 RepID=UPI0022551389|nr:ISAs1 family transposase [Streptomyces sp. NBC_01142]MCX4826994.1 ISAs1 family transposase [Streptomyces sp. NBC_01142]
MFIPPSSSVAAPAPHAPCLEVLGEAVARVQVRRLVAELESVTDPRGACGVRYRISSLLALVICAMTAAGHDSITAAAEWCRRATPEELAAFGLPYHPLLGRYRVPSEKTLRSVLGRLDPGEISAAGYDCLRPLLSAQPCRPDPVMPDGGTEREQRRAHRTAASAAPARSRRRAIAVDGKCLRGAKRPDGSRVFLLSAVRHGDGVTLASREIGAKTNEIPEFAPLLDHIDDTDLAGTVVTADALHAQRDHATYLHERGAHYLLTIKNNQRGQARQLHALPWKDIPVIHRDDARGHGRHEQRIVQVVTVAGLLFPYAAQALRIQRRRRLYGAKKWSSETVYAITDLTAEEASAAEIASWARGHWTVENTVHWVRDVAFGEDKSQVRTHNAPAVLAALRDLIRSALKLAGYVNTTAGRRAHTDRPRVLALYGIT